MIKFSIGRWTFRVFNFNCIGYWEGRHDGYDCLWDEWSFGFLLQVERETDYLLSLVEHYPALPKLRDKT